LVTLAAIWGAFPQIAFFTLRRTSRKSATASFFVFAGLFFLLDAFFFVAFVITHLPGPRIRSFPEVLIRAQGLLRALRAELRVSALSASVAGADSKLFDRKRNGALKMRRARENDFFLTI